jgi:hypothetical protein
MKPKNKYEKRVAELNATLTEDIAQSNVDWVKKECKKWDMRNFCYFTVHSKMAEFMVRRLYRVYKFTDKSTDHFFFVEIMREFRDGDKRLYFGKQRTMGPYYDCFLYNSEMQLRGTHKNFAYNDITMLFPLSVDSVSEDYSCSRVNCVTIDPKELGRIICNNPVAETMYKEHNPMFYHLMYRTYLKETCRAYTIAKRHGFVFNEETIPLWLDMVYAIIVCKKDWHNPVYIAPKDLRSTHDRFIRMMVRKQQENRLTREYNKIQRELERNKTINEQYVKRRKRFYDMVLTDGLISCRVLEDVQAFREEGEAMDHCVFKCRYFEKPYSLILSARINDKRVETIEVDLTSYTIKQCYGKHDQFTMYHQRIVDLVNAQMDTIKAYNTRKRSATKHLIAV